MTSQRNLYIFVPALAALMALTVADAAAQPAPVTDEQAEDRRVVVWRTKTDEAIDLEAVRDRSGFLGVGLLDLTPELRRHFGVPEDRGVMISRIVDDSPAARADLRPADIVTAIDDEPVDSSIRLSMRVATATEGDELRLERWRAGQRIELRIPLEVRERSRLDISPLIVRRFELGPGQEMEFETFQGGDQWIDHRWVEQAVETVGDQFAAGSFFAQLEALRSERNDLLDTLRRMEERLSALESELELLDRERPD